MSKSQEVQE